MGVIALRLLAVADEWLVSAVATFPPPNRTEIWLQQGTRI